ncbi:hypothetical protein HZB01_00995 [Candidatus Woesearchaeota archaeon]|nr:hypothetical protein [Candidatus Woesearchaeota archaeon]
MSTNALPTHTIEDLAQLVLSTYDDYNHVKGNNGIGIVEWIPWDIYRIDGEEGTQYPLKDALLTSITARKESAVVLNYTHFHTVIQSLLELTPKEDVIKMIREEIIETVDGKTWILVEHGEMLGPKYTFDAYDVFTRALQSAINYDPQKEQIVKAYKKMQQELGFDKFAEMLINRDPQVMGLETQLRKASGEITPDDTNVPAGNTFGGKKKAIMLTFPSYVTYVGGEEGIFYECSKAGRVFSNRNPSMEPTKEQLSKFPAVALRFNPWMYLAPSHESKVYHFTPTISPTLKPFG